MWMVLKPLFSLQDSVGKGSSAVNLSTNSIFVIKLKSWKWPKVFEISHYYYQKKILLHSIKAIFRPPRSRNDFLEQVCSKVWKNYLKDDAKLTCTETRRACHEIKVNDSKAGLDQNKSKSQNPQVACQPDSDTHTPISNENQVHHGRYIGSRSLVATRNRICRLVGPDFSSNLRKRSPRWFHGKVKCQIFMSVRVIVKFSITMYVT